MRAVAVLAAATAALAFSAPATAHPTELRDAMIGYGERFSGDDGDWEFVDLTWNAQNDWHAAGMLWFVQEDEDGYFEFSMQIAADRCIGGGIVTATPLRDGGRCPGRGWKRERARRSGGRKLTKGRSGTAA